MGQNIGDFNPRQYFHLNATVLTWTIGPNDEGAFIDADHAGGWTVNLPANPSEGDRYVIIDSSGFVDAAAQVTFQTTGNVVLIGLSIAGVFTAAASPQAYGTGTTAGSGAVVTYNAKLNQWLVVAGAQ
jgi:hypothetical protein